MLVTLNGCRISPLLTQLNHQTVDSGAKTAAPGSTHNRRIKRLKQSMSRSRAAIVFRLDGNTYDVQAYGDVRKRVGVDANNLRYQPIS